MSNEVLGFAEEIGAKDLKQMLQGTEFSSLIKKRNYFSLENGVFLIIKISRNKKQPFFGLGKQFFDLFNILTEKSGTYYFVGLETNNSGYVLSKSQIHNMISNESLSCSADGKEFKINYYNLKDNDHFLSPRSFRKKIGIDDTESID